MNQDQQASLLLFIAHFITSAHVSGFISFAIERMKKSSLPIFKWINHQTPWASRIVASVAAVLTAGGVSWTFDHHTGTAVISGLTVAGIGTALYHFAQNYLIQHGWYKAVFETPQPEQAREMLVKAVINKAI